MQLRRTLTHTRSGELTARRITRCASVGLDVFRGSRADLSPFYHNLLNGRSQVYDSKDREMSEWLKEHAWKLL